MGDRLIIYVCAAAGKVREEVCSKGWVGSGGMNDSYVRREEFGGRLSVTQSVQPGY